jgi:hypothetical protein
MNKSINILRGAVVTAIITLSSIGFTAQAGEINPQVKQNLMDALGKVFSAQVSALTTEINKDITKTIDENLIEMGFEIADKAKEEAESQINKLNQDK